MVQQQTRTTVDSFGNMVTPDGEIVYDEAPPSNNGRELQVARPVMEPIAAMVEGEQAPIHIRMMRELGIPSDVYSSYIGTPWRDLKPYLNKSVTIIGAAVWFSGSFKPKVPDGQESELQPGYYKVIMKIADTDEMRDVVIDREVYNIKYNIILQTSSKKVAELVFGFIQTHGWFDWPSGVSERVVFTGDQQQGFMARTLGDLKQFATKAQK